MIQRIDLGRGVSEVRNARVRTAEQLGPGEDGEIYLYPNWHCAGPWEGAVVKEEGEAAGRTVGLRGARGERDHNGKERLRSVERACWLRMETTGTVERGRQ
jgi:hypothetical protein